MTNATRQTAIVKPGGVIEIRDPKLPVGAVAEVIVLFETTEQPTLKPASSTTTPEDLGWPAGFLERFAGCLPDFPNIEPEGDYEVRDELA